MPSILIDAINAWGTAATDSVESLPYFGIRPSLLSPICCEIVEDGENVTFNNRAAVTPTTFTCAVAISAAFVLLLPVGVANELPKEVGFANFREFANSADPTRHSRDDDNPVETATVAGNALLGCDAVALYFPTHFITTDDTTTSSGKRNVASHTGSSSWSGKSILTYLDGFGEDVFASYTKADKAAQ